MTGRDPDQGRSQRTNEDDGRGLTGYLAEESSVSREAETEGRQRGAGVEWTTLGKERRKERTWEKEEMRNVSGRERRDSGGERKIYFPWIWYRTWNFSTKIIQHSLSISHSSKAPKQPPRPSAICLSASSLRPPHQLPLPSLPSGHIGLYRGAFAPRQVADPGAKVRIKDLGGRNRKIRKHGARGIFERKWPGVAFNWSFQMFDVHGLQPSEAGGGSQPICESLFLPDGGWGRWSSISQLPPHVPGLSLVCLRDFWDIVGAGWTASRKSWKFWALLSPGAINAWRTGASPGSCHLLPSWAGSEAWAIVSQRVLWGDRAPDVHTSKTGHLFCLSLPGQSLMCAS